MLLARTVVQHKGVLLRHHHHRHRSHRHHHYQGLPPLAIGCKIRVLLLSSCYAATPPSRRAMAPAVTREVVCFCLPCRYTLCGWYSKEWRNPPPPPQRPPQPPAALAAPPAALAAPPPLPSEWEEALPSTTKPKKCSSWRRPQRTCSWRPVHRRASADWAGGQVDRLMQWPPLPHGKTSLCSLLW